MERNSIGIMRRPKDNFSAYKINEYFANDYADDYDIFEKDKNNLAALEYLNDEFIDIDIDYSQTDQFEQKVFETLEKALKLIK